MGKIEERGKDGMGMIKNCRCGEYARIMFFDGEYAVECNGPDCVEWCADDYPALANSQEEAIKLWNEWVDKDDQHSY